MVEDKKKRFLERLQTYTDEPEHENLYFNFDIHAKKIAAFIMDDKTPTPFSIGINGEWGDGKTTLLNAVKKRIELYNKNDVRVIEFNAWKYEKTDVVAGLFQHIEDKHNKTKIAKIISCMLLDQALKSIVNISSDEMVEKYKESIKNIETISDTLEKIVGDNKFVIFVDDLDRCNPESMFKIFESIKMFLSVKNVIFVIAADMLKLEQAWQLRYRSELGAISGRQHLEKMFQLRLSISSKRDNMFIGYIRELLSMGDSNEVDELLDNFNLNPRAIKRTLNIVRFVLQDAQMIGNPQEEKNKYFEKYLKTLLLWITLISHHRHIAKIINHDPSYLLLASMICEDVKILELLKRAFKNDIGIQNMYKKCPEPVIELLKYVINEDESAFRIIRRFCLNLDMKYNFVAFDTKQSYLHRSDPVNLLGNVINESGLLGI